MRTVNHRAGAKFYPDASHKQVFSMSDRARYEHEIMSAKTMFNVEPDKSDYWRGYILGLMRSHYGENFCTTEVHEQWSHLVDDPDELAGKTDQ
jgi:hypothetical protein